MLVAKIVEIIVVASVCHAAGVGRNRMNGDWAGKCRMKHRYTVSPHLASKRRSSRSVKVKRNQGEGIPKANTVLLSRPIGMRQTKNINKTRFVDFRESWVAKKGGFDAIEIIYICCKAKRKKTDFFRLSF